MTASAAVRIEPEREARVLILAPAGRDARLAEQALARASLRSRICADLAELRREIAGGAGVVLMADEALSEEMVREPDSVFGTEPPWSQLPLVVLTGHRGRVRAGLHALRRLEHRRNVSFLQRPVPRMTLVSTLRAALEGRRRQYAVRDLVEELAEGVRHRDEFLATLGHELRNPVAAIGHGLELLRRDAPPHGETSGFAWELMQRQVRHLGRILDDLLDVSRVTRGNLDLQRSDVDLRNAIRSAAQSVRKQLEQRSHQLEILLPHEPVWVDADPTRVEQILWNLLGNAARYTPAGGHVSVSLTTGAGEARVRVADDGRGMTPEFLTRAFDLFAQAEIGGGGLGLGLPLARRLAELHGGTLEATSEGLGRGSEFVLRLPLRSEPPAAQPPSETSETPVARRVLVVEDNADLAWSLERLLQIMGHETHSVGTAHEALAVAADYRPDIVLLDIGLPDMHGAELARRLRERLGDAPLLAAMTGFGEEEVRRRTLASGCDCHFTKPLTPEDLRKLLVESVGRAGPGPTRSARG